MIVVKTAFLKQWKLNGMLGGKGLAGEEAVYQEARNSFSGVSYI